MVEEDDAMRPPAASARDGDAACAVTDGARGARCLLATARAGANSTEGTASACEAGMTLAAADEEEWAVLASADDGDVGAPLRRVADAEARCILRGATKGSELDW